MPRRPYTVVGVGLSFFELADDASIPEAAAFYLRKLGQDRALANKAQLWIYKIDATENLYARYVGKEEDEALVHALHLNRIAGPFTIGRN